MRILMAITMTWVCPNSFDFFVVIFLKNRHFQSFKRPMVAWNLFYGFKRPYVAWNPIGVKVVVSFAFFYVFRNFSYVPLTVRIVHEKSSKSVLINAVVTQQPLIALYQSNAFWYSALFRHIKNAYNPGRPPSGHWVRARLVKNRLLGRFSTNLTLIQWPEGGQPGL